MSCLNKHDFKKEKCTEFFAAYRECKKTWVCFRATFIFRVYMTILQMDQRKDDRRNGRDASIDVQYENNAKARNQT